MSARYVPPTPEEVSAADARRAELCRASLDGVPAERLELNGEEESELYELICQYAPVYLELIADGTISGETGETLGTEAPDGDEDDGREDTF